VEAGESKLKALADLEDAEGQSPLFSGRQSALLAVSPHGRRTNVALWAPLERSLIAFLRFLQILSLWELGFQFMCFGGQHKHSECSNTNH
jgi:hypothetical protein